MKYHISTTRRKYISMKNNKSTFNTDKYMHQVYEDAPGLKLINTTFNNMSINEYLMYVKETYVDNGSFTLDKDIEEAITDYATDIIGYDNTISCIDVLSKIPILHTADHHTVNFHTMTLQSNLLYERLLKMCIDTDVVPILSCNNIDMSNAFYPRGIIIYDTNTSRPLDIPIFPYKMRKVSISHAKPYTRDMLDKAVDALEKYKKNGSINTDIYDTTLRIIENVYANPDVLKRNRYGEQIILANSLLSQKYHTDKNVPHIFLELEEIAIRLICHDLQDNNSILNKMLWNRSILESLKKNLDGVSGCCSSAGGGTFLFWGIDDKGRRYRLLGETDNTTGTRINRLILAGNDLDGNVRRFELDRESLISALESRRLLPGLFMSFFALGIARHTCLIGGCYQGEYLKKMCDGIKQSWTDNESFIDEYVSFFLSSLEEKKFPYICGPLYLIGTNNGTYYPYGSVELWNSPLSTAKFNDAVNINFDRAQKLGLYCFYPDSIPPSLRDDNWRENICSELF